MNFLPLDTNFADILDEDVIGNSQPISLPSSQNTDVINVLEDSRLSNHSQNTRPPKHTGQQGEFRSTEEIDPKYRDVFTYPYFNLVQSRVLEDAVYSDKSMVVCAPTGSGKTVVFEMAIVQLLMDIEDNRYTGDFKIIYIAPVKALCNERLSEWYPKLTKLGLLCIEVTGDTDVDFPQLKPYRVIITTPEKWDMLTRRWKDYRGLVEVVKLFLIDEVHILNDDARGPVLEAVVSRMKTIEVSVQSAHRIEQLQKQYGGGRSSDTVTARPRIRFVAVSATVNNPEDVAAWLGAADRPAVYYKFGDECRPVKLKRVVEGYPCSPGTSIFKFDIVLNYKLWPIIQKYHDGKPTLIFCNTRKSVALTAEALSREITVNFSPAQRAQLTALAATIKNKKLQALILSGVGCHHAGLLYEERMNIEYAFRNRNLPILITTTTLGDDQANGPLDAMGVNLPAHLVIIKNTQQYVNGAYQEYSISTILQMVGRAGRPQFDTEATAVIMTRMADKARYQALVGGTEPLESFLHKRLAENLNSEAALGTVTDVAQCVQWVNSTFLSVRAAKDPRRYLGLPTTARPNEISKKIEELCVRAMNGLASAGLITMDEASCIDSTEAGRLMSVYYIDLGTMKLIMKINGTESLEQLLWLVCESHELSDMHLRVDERRCLNTLNRNSAGAATIRYPMKGKITTRQMKLNCVIQAVLGCLHIPEPSLNQEAMKIMRIALRVCKCLVAYTTRPTSVAHQPKTFSAVLNSIILAKCLTVNLWENSPYVSKQLRGIGPALSMLLASAGKTNFMLLEESHPRDLERIMNKGPPAGNVIRKQISLLPKYQLTITPIDRDRVRIQLSLLNAAYLSENLEHFTAGVNHSSYMIIGDSENCILYLMSFKNTDLIKIYDGCISCEITRKHSHEHKLMAYCISSSFVGIDVQSEYLFLNIGPVYHNICDNKTTTDFSESLHTIEQKSIDRKRKVNKNTEVTCSKEKIKRDNTLLENFKRLKESFGHAGDEIMGNLNKSTEMSNNILHNISLSKSNINNENFKSSFSNGNKDKHHLVTLDGVSSKDDAFEHLGEAEFVNNILTEIENEMGKSGAKREVQRNQVLPFDLHKIDSVRNIQPNELKKQRKNVRCNFNIIDKLEKDNDTQNNDMVEDNTGFTNTVKLRIDEYLENAGRAKDKSNQIKELFVMENEGMANMELNTKTISNYEVDQHSNGHPDVPDKVISPNQCDRGVFDDDPLCIENIEKESNMEIISQHRDLDTRENIDICNDMEKFSPKNIPISCSDNTLNSKAILSPASFIIINDNMSDVAVNQNERNLIISKADLHSRNFNSEEINENIQDFNKRDEIIDLVNKIDKGKEILQRFPNETNKKSYLSASQTLGRICESHNIDDNLCLENSNRSCVDFQFSNFKNPDLHYNFDNNTSDRHSNNYEDTHIEKYCLRKTRFDVCTKNDSKHTVKIIRKLKIDLDITKIISTKERNPSPNDSLQPIQDTKNGNPNALNSQDPELPSTDMAELGLKTSQGTNANIHSNSSEYVQIKTFATNNRDFKPNDSKAKSPKKLENIFKKYSKIISSRKTNTSEVPSVKQVPVKNIMNLPIGQHRRRYKITDIQKLEEPFQKKNIDTEQKLINFNRQTMQEIDNIDNRFNTISKDTELSKTCNILTNQVNVVAPLESDFSSEIDNDFENNIDMLYNKSKTEVTNCTYNINTTLLNPKTLLEYYNNLNDNNEIIPPPREFSDMAIDLPPHVSSTNAYTPSSPDYGSETYNYDSINMGPERKTNWGSNIFDEHPQFDLGSRPSREIEPLPPSNDTQNCGLIKKQLKNYTSVRNNTSDVSDSDLKNSNRLGDFKFKRKSLLKLKK